MASKKKTPSKKKGAATAGLEENIDQLTSDDYMPYLLEVRKRLTFTAAIFVLSAILGFVYYEKVVQIAVQFFNLEGVNIVFTSPFQFINLAINSALMIGFVVVLPFLIAQILMFAKPALEETEYKLVKYLLMFGIGLFTLGMTFGVFVMRYIVVIFYEQSVTLDIGNFLDVSKLLSQVLLTGTLMGLAFQFPIVLTFLMRYNMVSYHELVKQRPFAYASSLLFAAFLPPTDLLSLVLLTVPLIVLFELTLFLNRYVLKAHLISE